MTKREEKICWNILFELAVLSGELKVSKDKKAANWSYLDKNSLIERLDSIGLEFLTNMKLDKDEL